MIHDIDESLRALVKRDAAMGSSVDVNFEAPTKEWVARRNSNVVNLYLYDIREDTTRRETAWVEMRDASGRVTGRRLPPRRYRLSYLVTAWTTRPEDEHRLLSQMLACLVRHEFMPGDLLTGSLENEELPILMTVALPPNEDRSIADVWSAVGGELKPSLDLVVTAPMNIERMLEAGPPVLELPRLEMLASDSATADGAAENGSSKSARSSKRKSGASGVTRVPAATANDDTDLADETVIAGATQQRGRHIRVRAIERP